MAGVISYQMSETFHMKFGGNIIILNKHIFIEKIEWGVKCVQS